VGAHHLDGRERLERRVPLPHRRPSATRARLKFLSLEPLLGPLHDLDIRGIDWVIVGGESGSKAQPMDPTWAIDLRDQCRRAEVPFFFKQWGGNDKKQAGRLLDGRTWDQMPPDPVVLRSDRGGATFRSRLSRRRPACSSPLSPMRPAETALRRCRREVGPDVRKGETRV